MSVHGAANGVTPQFTAGVSVTGVLTIEPGGIWGLLEVAAGTSGALPGIGFRLEGYMALAVNTLTSGPRPIVRKVIDLNQASLPLITQTISLSPATTFLSIAGRLQLRQGSGNTATDAFWCRRQF